MNGSGNSRARIVLSPDEGGGPPDGKALLAVQEKYGVEMDMASIPTLVERHGLVTGEPPTPETASSYQSGARARHNPGLPPHRTAVERERLMLDLSPGWTGLPN